MIESYVIGGPKLVIMNPHPIDCRNLVQQSIVSRNVFPGIITNYPWNRIGKNTSRLNRYKYLVIIKARRKFARKMLEHANLDVGIADTRSVKTPVKFFHD